MEKTSSLKKAPLKTLRVLDPTKTSPFVVPTTKEKTPTRNTPMVAIPLKAVTNHFPQVGGNPTQEASGVIFDPTQGDEGVETPPPNDSFQASLSPPVGGRLHSFRRDWLTNKCSNNMLNIITNVYVLPFISKPNLARAPLIRSGYKALQKEIALTSCMYPVSSVKERNRKGEKCKISRVLQSPVSCTQASPKVEASNRPKKTHHLPTCRKVQNGNTRVHQGLSDSRGMGVIDSPIRCLPSHSHPSELKIVPKVLPQVASVSVHFPSLWTIHGPSGLYNDCKRGEVNGSVKGNQTSPAPGRLADQGQVSRRSTSKHSDSGGPNFFFRVDNKSGEVRTKTY